MMDALLFVRNKFFIVVFICLFSWFFSSPAEAAGGSFSLVPGTGTYEAGQVFTVLVKANTGGQAINAADGAIMFDTDKLEVKNVIQNGSIFSMWIIPPVFDNEKGVIRWSGGIPQPGYSGNSGMILAIDFVGKLPGEAQTGFTEGAMLANDGKGSNILTTMASARFKIIPAVAPPAEGTIAPAAAKETSENGSVQPVNQQFVPVINSTTHPDTSAWYTNNSVSFDWKMPERAEAVNFAFDDRPDTDPKVTCKDMTTSVDIGKKEDGIWYFHLKIKSGAAWSAVAHRRVQIDTTPPQPFVIEVLQEDLEDWPILRFRANDNGSGILQYEVKVGSLEERGYLITEEEASLQPTGLEAGKHTAIIKAIDKAGNETYSSINFNIIALEAPRINYAPNEVTQSDKVFLSGTALPDSTVFVNFEDSNRLIASTSARSDSGGNWNILFDGNLKNGRYVAWAQAANKNGLPSNPSERVSFLVAPSALGKIGSFVINYFTMIASLLFVATLTIIGIIFIVILLRSRLKKETVEVESVLKSNFKDLRETLNQEFSAIPRTASGRAESARMKARLSGIIETSERKIMKEIKDVEKILK